MLLTICWTAIGQTRKETTAKTSRTLTYYYFGYAPGNYIDTESQYGFRMKWKKCMIKDRHVRHNERVEKKINARLGENWLVSYFEKLETNSAAQLIEK